MSDLFSVERLISDTRKEIRLAREWLDSIERDVDRDAGCINAATLLYLSESCAKLNYTVGMFNKAKLTDRGIGVAARLTDEAPNEIEQRILREEAEILNESGI